MSLHLAKSYVDIETMIPDTEFRGLAVIDFESYKPLWDEDWDALAVYRDLSRKLVITHHPDWSKSQIEAEAKFQFETAAR